MVAPRVSSTRGERPDAHQRSTALHRNQQSTVPSLLVTTANGSIGFPYEAHHCAPARRYEQRVPTES